MYLPNQKHAYIDRRKLTEYLLDPNHPDAKGKGAFFRGRYGSDWERLRDALMEHASEPVANTHETRHGTLYVIEDILGGAPVRSVWIVRIGEAFPRLVTAYPFTP